MKKIPIHSLSIKRESLTLKPLSPTFEKGEIFAVLGRAGSGRTASPEVIGDMFPGTGGSIQYDGIDAMDIPSRSRRLGFVHQDHGLFLHIKVCDNTSYNLKMHGFSKEEQRRRASDLMEMLPTIHIKDQYPSTLSRRESQRIALARVLMLEPEILLLDELLSALDPATRKRLYLELTRIHEHFRCTIIFITHDFVEARLLAHRVGILLNGELKVVVSSDRLTGEHYCEEVE